MVSKLYFKLLTASVLLLSSLIYITPVHAEFGFSGLEFSPVRTFASANSDDYTSYSGTVNFELNDPTSELSIPFLWTDSDDSFLSEKSSSLVVDLQWRKFDKPARSGGYVGVLLRGISSKSEQDGERNARQTDLGVGILAGFRRNISSGFYWGANMSLVALANEPKQMNLEEVDLFRQKVSLTVDFLKIGYQF